MTIRFGVDAYDPALLVLRAKGFDLKLEAQDDRYAEWHATKDGHTFTATNPVELLGIVALWETRGEAWERAADEPSPYEELVESRIL